MNNFLYLLRSITLTVMLVIGVSSVTYGQLTSQINGTITDGTGAMMPEVGVTVAGRAVVGPGRQTGG